MANRSPDDIRNALSAMQRGWQQGRAANDGDLTEPGAAGPDGSYDALGNGSSGSGYAGSAGGSLSGEERLVTDDDRTAGQSSGTGAGGNGHGADYGSTGGRDGTGGYGTADSYGVGSVGYPDYASEPDYSDVHWTDVAIRSGVPDGGLRQHHRPGRRQRARRGSGGQPQQRGARLSRGKR